MSRLLYRAYSTHQLIRQHTLSDIYKTYNSKIPITVITVHDFITAKLADSVPKIDAVLIGDSLAMVSKGYSSTLELPFDEFKYTCNSILRGIDEKFVIADLPFGSFESSISKCVESSIELMKLGKVGSIKIEGGFEMTEKIIALRNAGIPVTGHIGLQPQKMNLMGGYKIQGKNSVDALSIYKQALHLQECGCSLIVFECMPSKIAEYITKKLDVPTIGIGAGNGTSGQVLVMSDILGMLNNKNAKFVKQYLNFYQLGFDALKNYSVDVKSLKFPLNDLHDYGIKDEEFENFVTEAEKI